MKLYKPTTPRKAYNRGHNYGEVQITPSQRHVGKYYWCNYWHHWDKVLRVNVYGYMVEVVQCNDAGQPVAPPRTHCTGMGPAMFADKPFKITRD